MGATLPCLWMDPSPTSSRGGGSHHGPKQAFSPHSQPSTMHRSRAQTRRQRLSNTGPSTSGPSVPSSHPPCQAKSKELFTDGLGVTTHSPHPPHPPLTGVLVTQTVSVNVREKVNINLASLYFSPPQTQKPKGIG